MDTPSAEQAATASSPADGAVAPATAGAAADKILEAAASSPGEKTPDAKAEPAKPVDPAKPKVSPELAALAKRERTLTQTERTLKEREAQLAERQTKYAPVIEAIEKRDVRALIKLTGAPLPDVIEALSQLDDEPVAKEPTPAEIARAEAQKVFDEAKRLDAEQAKKDFDERYARTVAAKTTELERLAKSDVERWERISTGDTVRWEEGERVEHIDPHVAAWRLIEKWHAETGQILKLEEALDEIEALQLEKHQRIAKGKKLGASPDPKKPSTEAGTAAKTGRAATPTISNRDGGRAVAASDNDVEEPNHIAGLPDSARIERAMRRAGISA